MESLRNEPVSINGYGGGYGGGGGDFLSTILAASILGGGNRGTAYQPALVDIGTLFNEKSAADTRSDVKESESEIRESILTQALANGAEFRGLDCKLSSIDKEALASRYESQIATKDSTVLLANKVDVETNQIRNKLDRMENGFERHFDNLKTDLFRSLTAIRERELQDEIGDLRRSISRQREENQTNEIVTKLLTVLKPGTQPPI